jgi:hypothetical protein
MALALPVRPIRGFRHCRIGSSVLGTMLEYITFRLDPGASVKKVRIALAFHRQSQHSASQLIRLHGFIATRLTSATRRRKPPLKAPASALDNVDDRLIALRELCDTYRFN